ncbi:DNA (cytosine-5-)-methyltransferase [Caulobacter segnis]|uniref:DNA (cytosine-5-)-methyltransferase n=2 Tax=Caulobacter segnis TaxID=88688 RepID=D5VPV1_CAUST|nr:DNA cytosine methyltransferase [Caulobacter segnis]ADG12524.1 DNA-cytosine methyltransferase [Caulobacter segnis ATCC 21756]AVQ04101.1 DNA (cytosine-5-)-methyltransferase [Caulobacter segnis]
MNRNPRPTFLEFFAGGGMARIGLGNGWTCAFANDFDPVKAATYRANFGADEGHFQQGDVFALSAETLPTADLAWASSPCQDFSLAGARAGLAGGKSSAFFGFWTLMKAMSAEERAPPVIVIENVVGLLTSHHGDDFNALCGALSQEGYRFGAVEIDASAFVPQSRPRVFVIATRLPTAGLEGASGFHSRAIREAAARLPEDLKAHWIWWGVPSPPARNTDLAAMLEPDTAVTWNPPERTEALLALMALSHRQAVEARIQAGGRSVGAVFRRMRGGQQRAEVRFDGLAGCLRTPRGGSSRQTLLVIDEGRVRSRLLTPREGARLMGLPDSYQLPASQTSGLQVVGDGVAVPAVRWLAETLLEPLVYSKTASLAAE